MSEEHARYQQLAVGHVLGGLAPEDAAAFRDHLSGCRVCRARVAELRGIASDLERAERDERARALVRTDVEVPTETEEPSRRPAAEPDAEQRRRRNRLTVGAVVSLLLVVGLAFWNLHLRTTNAVVAGVAEEQTETLQLLVEGTEVPVEADAPVRGRAAVDGERVALALAGIEAASEDGRIVVWLRDGEQAQPVAQVLPRQLSDGHLALTVDDGDARELVATLEAGALGDQPAGERLATVAVRDG